MNEWRAKLQKWWVVRVSNVTTRRELLHLSLPRNVERLGWIASITNLPRSTLWSLKGSFLLTKDKSTIDIREKGGQTHLSIGHCPEVGTLGSNLYSIPISLKMFTIYSTKWDFFSHFLLKIPMLLFVINVPKTIWQPTLIVFSNFFILKWNYHLKSELKMKLCNHESGMNYCNI